jgi:putative tryptophan/tyrosine transport system substrate-binding protein
MPSMGRREFVALLGGAAAARPYKAYAQQPARQVIGFVHLTSMEETKEYLPAFHQGLSDTGYVEGKNLAIEYRWGEGHNDRLPILVADLVQRQVSVIVTLESTLAALAAKKATQTIPVIFMQRADPVQIGLVDTLNRPGGNLTGINLFLAEVAAKRLELLLILVPGVRSVAYLRNPTNPVFAESEAQEVQAAARSFGVQLEFLNASDLNGIERAFVDPPMKRTNALFVSADGFLLTHSDRIVALASRNAVPAAYCWSQAVRLGGLMSYGTNFGNAWRQAGIYAGRILNGERPAVLPVQQVTKSICLSIKSLLGRSASWCPCCCLAAPMR